MLKRFFITVVILVVIGLGGYVVYYIAYGLGEAAGYDKGYPAGQSAGYSSGEEVGYASGTQDGYTEGYNSGKADGYDEGMQAGLGHGYTLRDPTYAQALAFIKDDKTDENEYIEDAYGVYVCTHFSRDVCNNAEQQGIRCAFVEVRYPDGGHALIAFDTIDEGLVYFDAVSDDRARPVIGERYYQCLEPKPGYYYERPSFDDTIMDILVIW
jgi:hypothetical protein